MKDLLPTIQDWAKDSKPFALATVVSTWGSSPRPVGSSMIISSDLEMAGSVSGGCVEGAVAKAAEKVLSSGEGMRLKYGVSDDEAWTVGLSCGGKISVYLEPFIAIDDRPKEQMVWKKLESCLSSDRSCVLLTEMIDGANRHALLDASGNLFGHEFPEKVNEEARSAQTQRASRIVEHDDVQYFARVFPRRSQMLIIGAAHVTSHLVELAHLFDFSTTVIDPRGAFAQKTQFRVAPDEIVEAYPSEVLENYQLDAFSYAVILSHDPKIDDNALRILLRSDIAYIGALGSRRTHAKRVDRLKAAGYSDEEIDKIHAPIGMDINAKKPREIALSILGEVIQAQNAFL